MKERSTDNNQSTSDNYRFSLTRGHIAALVASPLNTLVRASGHVVQRDMMRTGLCLNLSAIAVIILLFHFGVAR